MAVRVILFILVGIWSGAAVPPADGRILSVKPIEGIPGRIIAAPRQALDGAIASSTHMLGFDERQNVVLSKDLGVDNGVIPKGTRVDSHMILYNTPEEALGSYAQNEWVFSGSVLGVMSDTDGLYEAASNDILGAPGTSYPVDGFFLRGFEENDGYDGVGTSHLRIWMTVWQPGDWIRVITRPGPIATRPIPPARSPELAQRGPEKTPERNGHGTHP
jgi:hypothetical protein